MITDERRYLNPFSPHGAAVLDLSNTERLKSTHPTADPFLFTDHKKSAPYPTSRYLSCNASTYLL